MNDEAASLPPFAPDVFVEDAGHVTLLGGECSQCGAVSFPRLAVCPQDGAAVTLRSLGSNGSLYSYTVIHVRAPFGLPSPYGIGAVDLDDVKLRVTMLLDPDHLDGLSIGANLRLSAGAMGVDLTGAACRRPYFTPANGQR